MELVDIWHFLLSEILLRCGGDQIKAAAYVESQHASQHAATSLGFDGQDYDTDRLSLLELIQLLIGTAAAGRIELGLFASILAKSELSWSELYRQYVSKNVLNFFRQDHGYQEGTYEKMWGGREDNEILVDAMRALDPLDAEFKDKLYASLQASYTAAFPRP
jgi:hypothetical protein